MAASWIIVAASLAVASSQSTSPWQIKHGLNANSPAFYQRVSPAQAAQQSLARQECPGCFAEPQTLEAAITAEVNSKSQYAPGSKNANTQCPGPYCSYVQPQSFEDAIVVQAIPKSQYSLGWKNTNVQCPGPHCPYVQPQSFEDAVVVRAIPKSQYSLGWKNANVQCPGPHCASAQPQSFEDAITVQVSSKNQYTPGFRKANPQCPGIYCAQAQPQFFQDAIVLQTSPRNFPAQQSSSFAVIPQGPQPLSPASPLVTLAVLDDGTPVAVLPAGSKSQVLVEDPQSSARFITPQQSLAQPATYLLENNTPITVAPAQAKTFQSAQLSVLAVIPQGASVKFANLQQAAPTIPQVPTPASIRAQLFGAPATLVPLNHQNVQQAPAQATVISKSAL